MAAAVSLLNCLTQPLPDYPYTGGAHTPSAGGTTARGTLPPRFAIQRQNTGSDRWSRIGERYLRQQGYQIGTTPNIRTARAQYQALVSNPNVSAANRLVYQPGLDAVDSFLNNRQFVPQTEDNIRHTNEADVVRTANLYLIHPVIQALWSHPYYHAGLISQSEDSQNGTRTDITLTKVNRNQLHRSFAVVEFKRRGAIAGQSFMHNLQMPPNTGFTNPQAYLAHIVAPVAAGQQPTAQQLAAIRSVPLTRFTSGPLTLIKQATAYAIEHRTRFIVLFNYDWLICCYFPWLDPTKSANQLLQENRASLSEFPVELDMYEKSTNAQEMRLALLGFLWTAIENTP